MTITQFIPDRQHTKSNLDREVHFCRKDRHRSSQCTRVCWCASRYSDTANRRCTWTEPNIADRQSVESSRWRAQIPCERRPVKSRGSLPRRSSGTLDCASWGEHLGTAGSRIRDSSPHRTAESCRHARSGASETATCPWTGFDRHRSRTYSKQDILHGLGSQAINVSKAGKIFYILTVPQQ